MIVTRYTWRVKVGCSSEVVKLVKAVVEEAGLTPRVCTFTYGRLDTVTSDLEFETEEDRQIWLAGFDSSQPALAEWHKRQPDLIESGTIKELLQVH